MASVQMAHLKLTMQKMMEMGLVAKFDGTLDPQILRNVVGSAQTRMPAMPGVRFESCSLGGVEAECSVPEKVEQNAVIFYIHGGGLICGDALSSRGFASMLALETSHPVYSISYRLAPEHKCPAAIEDCFAAYRELLEKHPGLPVFLIGESGGAYLSITTTLLARDSGTSMPAGVILYSPPVDLSGRLNRNHPANRDFTVSPEGLAGLGKMYYSDEAQYTDPIATPYFADYRGFAPTYLVWDESESLAVDAQFLRDALTEAGVELVAESYPGCFHSFPTCGRGTPEGSQVMDHAVAFMENRIRGKKN